MKLFELKLTQDGFTISRDSDSNSNSDRRLTGHQKYVLLLTWISCSAACKVILAFFSLLQ